MRTTRIFLSPASADDAMSAKANRPNAHPRSLRIMATLSEIVRRLVIAADYRKGSAEGKASPTMSAAIGGGSAYKNPHQSLRSWWGLSMKRERLYDHFLEALEGQRLDDGARGLGLDLDRFLGLGIDAHACGLL